MIRRLLKLLGYEIVYRDARGEHAYRYDSRDAASGRPIHDQMSVAYPSAKMIIRRKR